MKDGQIAKFHTPNEDEDPNQLYVVLEIKGDDDSARVDIKALNTGLSFPPVYLPWFLQQFLFFLF
jgi:hypothetical protein